MMFTEASSTNVFTLVVEPNVDSFRIANTSANTKTVVITNPFVDAEITIKLEYRIAATITMPTSITWKDAVAPVYVLGKTYFIYLVTDDKGVSYQGTWTGSW